MLCCHGKPDGSGLCPRTLVAQGRPAVSQRTLQGVTSAGYASRSGKPAVPESLGLPDRGCHARDEPIEIDAIVPRLCLSARLLIELGRERGPAR